MDERDALTGRFEAERGRLRGVAYRLLGSLADADDAVQEAWLRASAADVDAVEDLGAWLTTIAARVSLNMLRARRSRHEEQLPERLPDPLVSSGDALDPEQQALSADSVELAMLVVLDTLGPDERLAFVLHDMFAVPFDEIAAVIGRSPDATRQLASRARRKVHDTAPEPDPDHSRRRAAVQAFRAAARDGDFAGIVAVLHPDVVLRVDTGTWNEIRGATAVASQASSFSAPGVRRELALVNGSPGIVTYSAGRPIAVLGFTVVAGQIVEMDILADERRLARLGLA